MRVLAGKLLRLSPIEWVDLVRAQLALIRSRVSVWARPRGQLVSPSNEPPDGGRGDVTVEPVVRRMESAVRRASKYGLFRPTCLVRAIALVRLLEARGLTDCRVRIGVMKQGEQLAAHAWVEYRGVVVGDPPGVADSFAELSDVEVST